MEPQLSDGFSHSQLEGGCPGSRSYRLIKSQMHSLKRKKGLRREQLRTTRTVRKIAKQKHTTIPVELKLAQESYNHLLETHKMSTDDSSSILIPSA